ncbi:NAD(P)/FAD-dependent oxidoreductase [Oricola thermophila]|uniref:FAD-binding oxidoreductase n=1 Tax=Oricola thermophila TaxID=2742145 RepID=A0A6N1VD28_9HYPH|nr:FAD-dependent oxidoreductase [Oricola thermophila]QKV18961.1 FAD-binding oxidoreductase [Oricola thermophila]
MKNNAVHNSRGGLEIAVIGAGIVGSATALALAEDGHTVTVYDPAAPGSGTSFGNAGAIVTGSVMPNATPDVLKSIPGYLLDRDGPAVLRLAHLPRALPWLWRFVSAGRITEVERISRALGPLVTQALEDYQPLLRLSGADNCIRQAGWLKVYASEAEFATTRLERRLQAKAGIKAEVLDRDALLRLEPALSPEVCRMGLFQSRSGFVANPRGLAEAFARAAQSRGARHVRAKVDRIVSRQDGPSLVGACGMNRPFDKIVVAAGAWSRRLVRDVGDRVLLDAERGYHMIFATGRDALLSRPVCFPGIGMVLSPMIGGLRVLNGTELAGLDAPPDYRRIRQLKNQAHKVLPALTGQPVGNEWMGFRPSTPDSLPVIGPSPRNPNVFYAFGHGHLGVTMAATTARMIRSMIARGGPGKDATPYLIDRFC